MHPLDPAEFNGSFGGQLLVAHPSLREPTFRHSVLYLSAHEAAAGAFGLILNRPLGKMAAELLPEHERSDVLALTPVYLGGPVGQDQLSFAHVRWDPLGEVIEFKHNLSLDELAERAEDEPSSIRGFVGYAGWSAGQLEGELEQKAWVLLPPRPDAVSAGAGEPLWFGIMSELGPAYKLLAAAPDDPALN